MVYDLRTGRAQAIAISPTLMRREAAIAGSRVVWTDVTNPELESGEIYSASLPEEDR
jgi:hypothetical protein